MKISDETVAMLKSLARRPLIRGLHPEDAAMYRLGLDDGATTLAQEILDVLKPDVVVPEELKESD